MNQVPIPPTTTRPESQVIAENMKRSREASGLTQEEVAEKSGIPLRTIQRAEAGDKVREEALQCVAKVLGTTPDLLRFDLDNPPSELREKVTDMIAQMTGTGPWRHIPVKPLITPLDVETHLIGNRSFGLIPHKDPALSAEALDKVSEIFGELRDLDCVDAGDRFAWKTAKQVSALLEELDQLGGAMLAGTIRLTLRSVSGGKTFKTPGDWLILAFVPKGSVKPTMAFDLRDLPDSISETDPKTWTPIPGEP